jgi:hypothetical protein
VDLLGLELGLSSESAIIVTAIRPKFRNLLIFLRNTHLTKVKLLLLSTHAPDQVATAVLCSPKLPSQVVARSLSFRSQSIEQTEYSNIDEVLHGMIWCKSESHRV